MRFMTISLPMPPSPISAAISALNAGSDKTAFDGAVPLTVVTGLRYLIPEWKLETELVGTFAKGVTRRADPDAYKPAGYAVFDVYGKWKPTEMIDQSPACRIFSTSVISRIRWPALI